MGICGGGMSAAEQARLKEEKNRSRELEKKMSKSHNDENSVNKLLLLGAGESGKSTLFKQMITIYGKGFSDEERQEYISIIHTNIITSMKTLCEQSDELEEKAGGTRVHAQLEPSKAWVLDAKETEFIDENIVQHLKALWQDAGIQKTYSLRSQYQLTDSTSYFMEKLTEIGQPNYLPTEQDVLRSRVRTTGIVENEFEIDGNRFKMFDVGGQRNERKKWIHCFSEVTAVLFVAALSAYDLVLYEDEDTNRMEEALTLFDEICNSRWFKTTSMILMLNKKDLFLEKYQQVPITKFFKDYAGSLEDPDAQMEYIKQQFEARKKNPGQLYCHFTQATDKGLMKNIFNAVKDIVIRQSLHDGGLLS